MHVYLEKSVNFICKRTYKKNYKNPARINVIQMEPNSVAMQRYSQFLALIYSMHLPKRLPFYPMLVQCFPSSIERKDGSDQEVALHMANYFPYYSKFSLLHQPGTKYYFFRNLK
jgi:hypothetical protein